MRERKQLKVRHISSSVLSLLWNQDHAGPEYWLWAAQRSVNSFWVWRTLPYWPDIADTDLLVQEQEVTAFLVVFVLTITLSRIDYQCQVMRIAASGLQYVYPFFSAPTHAWLRLLCKTIAQRLSGISSYPWGSWNTEVAPSYTPAA